jgi:hypothetical protein
MKLHWLSQGPGGVSASCSNCGGTVCWWCWASPDFVACKEECERNNAGNQAAIDACVCRNCVKDDLCGGVGTRNPHAYGWRVRSDETCIHQDEVNRVLVANGYNPIARDCILGPLTCGASRVATDIDASVGIPSPCFDHQSEWRLPTKAGQAPPPPAPVAKKRNTGALLILGTLVGLAAYGYANS